MKNYRKRAAESFRSGIESPLEALGTRALREAQAELQHKAAESDDRDPDALALLDEALAHEPRDAHERRAAARAYLGVTTTRTKRAVRVERVATKNNERDVWTSWVNVGFPIADKMMRAAIAERLESERITEDEGQELLDLLDAIGANSSNDKIEPDYYEDLVADMRELGDRTTAMDWGNNFPYENWHRDADELEKYGDGLRDWYGDDWKSAPASRTKAFADRDELALALREWSDEASDAEDEALATGLSDAARLVENGDLREAVDAILDSVPDGPDSEKATGMIQDFINESKSAPSISTKGAMPIVAFDAANEEGLDDLEADVNDLAYKHNASGMDADTSGGHCEVYFEAAIDAANFVEALQAGDLIGYTVSNLELVPTDGNGDDGEEKNTEGVETKSVDDSFAEIFDAAETAREAYMVVKTLFADSSYAVAQDERDSGVDTTADDWEGDDPLLDGHRIFQNAAIYPSHYEKLFGARINVGPENLAQAYAEVDEWKRIVEEAQDSVASAECSGPLAQKYQDAILGAIPDYLNALDDLRNALANYEGELEQESADDDEDKSLSGVETKSGRSDPRDALWEIAERDGIRGADWAQQLSDLGDELDNASSQDEYITIADKVEAIASGMVSDELQEELESIAEKIIDEAEVMEQDDDEEDDDDKRAGTVETKGTGYEEFRGCVGWLSSAIKGAEDMGADLGDAYDWVGEMFERTKYLPVSFTQDDIDTWSSQLDQIRSLLEGALSEVEDEDETAKGKLPAQKRSLTEGLRQVDRAIEAIDDLEPDSEDEGD